MNTLDQLINNAQDRFDLTSEDSQNSLFRLAEELLALDHQPSGNPEHPLEFRIAEKLVDSRNKILSITTELKLGVVFAMWGEQNRMYPKSDSNPNGEDTLRTKVRQLDWICKDSKVSWHLYAVDDGCPYQSGQIAEDIARDLNRPDQIKILFLEKELPQSVGPLKNLASADDSRKGGSIILGGQKAIEDGMDAVMYTDADNSVHLSQIGILLHPFANEGYRAVLGNRKDPASILVKQENRWGIGIKLLRHMQRMVGHAIFSQGILDTQAAFKLYEARLLREIIADPGVFDFSFDSDWIATVLARQEPWTRVPFAFIDSFEESASITQGPMTTWETLLLGLLKAVRHRGLAHNEEMARVLEEEITSSEVLDLLIDKLPEELMNASDQELGDPGIMSPEKVREWIREVKGE